MMIDKYVLVSEWRCYVWVKMIVMSVYWRNKILFVYDDVFMWVFSWFKVIRDVWEYSEEKWVCFYDEMICMCIIMVEFLFFVVWEM